MTLTTVLGMLKNLLPLLEPLGEQGITNLFTSIGTEVDKMSDSSDLKVLAKILLPGLQQFAVMELQKLKV